MKKLIYGALLLSLTASSSVSGSDKKEITVFAAASTTNAVMDIAKEYTAETGVKVKFNLGSSGKLARQMEQGAPADLYISASTKWADYAKQKDLLKNDTITSFMKNSLVLVVPLDSSIKPFTLTEKSNLPKLFKGRLSIGDPRHVPAGKYAVQALKYYKWYEALKPRFQPAMDVRAALMVVELGEASMGIVYSTDAKKSKKVKEVAVFPEKSHSPVVYVCAEVKGGDSAGFRKFLLGEKAAVILKKYGFVPLKK